MEPFYEQKIIIQIIIIVYTHIKMFLSEEALFVDISLKN